MIIRLLESLTSFFSLSSYSVEVLLTLNVSEPDLVAESISKKLSFDLRIIDNIRSHGFGANHNKAFNLARGQWFGVINPDIIWFDPAMAGSDDFFAWLHSLPKSVGMVAPAQVDINGKPQDSFRELVTPTSAVLRTIQRCFGRRANAGVARSVCTSDWVNAACLIIRAQVYRSLGGFDERYFMYCEDADFCLRLQLAGHTMADAGFAVIHDAQRNTFRQPRHLWWHLSSLLRFWCSGVFWRYWLTKQRKAGSRSHTGRP